MISTITPNVTGRSQKRCSVSFGRSVSAHTRPRSSCSARGRVTTLITKAGGFGDPDLLFQVRGKLSYDRR